MALTATNKHRYCIASCKLQPTVLSNFPPLEDGKYSSLLYTSVLQFPVVPWHISHIDSSLLGKLHNIFTVSL